jgi:hypothetical protein
MWTGDEDLVKDLLKEMNISAEIVSDLTCAGGLNAYSPMNAS